MWPTALVPGSARLPPVDELPFRVADLTDGRAARRFDQPDLSGGHPQVRVLSFLREQLDAGTRRARDLCAAAGSQLDTVHDRSDGDVAQRQRIARLDVGAFTGLDHVADAKLVRRKDVPLLAVLVVQERDARVAVRVVLDREHLRRDPVLVPTEVDDAVAALVPAAAVARGRASVRVPSAGALNRLGQPLLGARPRQLRVVGAARAAASRRRWLVPSDAHRLPARVEDLDRVALGEGDDRTLL